MHKGTFCWQDKRHLISTVIASADTTHSHAYGIQSALNTFVQSKGEPLNSTRRHDSSS